MENSIMLEDNKGAELGFELMLNGNVEVYINENDPYYDDRSRTATANICTKDQAVSIIMFLEEAFKDA